MPTTPIPPAVATVLLSIPSRRISLVWKRPPPATKGRLDATPFTGTELPEISPSAQTFLPLRGRSLILVLSMTWPNEEVDVSIRGTPPVTSIDLEVAPG